MLLESLQFTTIKVPSPWPLEITDVLLLAERKRDSLLYEPLILKSTQRFLRFIMGYSTDQVVDTIFEIA